MESIGIINEYVFSGCPNLESVEIDGAETVGKYAFRNCESLKSVVLKNVNTIGVSVFSSCENLSSVTMESIGTIGASTFYSCERISSITIDAESIGRRAFSDCISLTDVVIGKNVKSIDNIDGSCFNNCSQLISVRFEDTEGWYYYGDSSNKTYIDVTDDTENASNLQGYSYEYLWYKE